MKTTDPIAGYDIPAVEAWIRANAPALKPPLVWTRLQGGHSNLTYLIEDASGRKAVIRRPPLGELLPKAHDMGREWALISALGPTAVPVPAALGFCDDTAVTGARFYIMGHVDGRPLYTADDTRRLVPEPQREKLAHSFIDVLADLHAVDPDAVDLVSVLDGVNWAGEIRRSARAQPPRIPARATAGSRPGAHRARRLRPAQHPDRSGSYDRGRGRLGDLDTRRSARGPCLRAQSVSRSQRSRSEMGRSPDRAAGLSVPHHAGGSLCGAHRARSVEARLLHRLQPLEERRDIQRRH
jgi:hypothetical protein